jgi:hypothetical protein
MMAPMPCWEVDLSVRVLAKMRLHLPLQGLDLLIEGAYHRDQGAGGGGVGGGQGRRLGQLLAAQRGQDDGSPLGDVAAPGALERRGHLRAGQPRGAGRLGCPAEQFQGLGGVQVGEGLQRGGEVLAQLVPQPLHRPGPLPDQRLVGAGHHLDRFRLGAIPGRGPQLVGIGADHVRQHVRVAEAGTDHPNGSVCHSGGSAREFFDLSTTLRYFCHGTPVQACRWARTWQLRVGLWRSCSLSAATGRCPVLEAF